MESRSERKWKTLRNIGSPQEESHLAVNGPEGDEVGGTGQGEHPAPVSEAPPEVLPEPEPEGVAEISSAERGGPAESGGLAASPPLAAEQEEEPERVLVVLPVASTTRLIRETLRNFTEAEVVSTSDPLRGFELALQRSYRIFLFGMQIGELSGPMLYELISKAYATDHGPKRLAPGVVFIREEEDPKLPGELVRDVRVKAVISKPVKIDRLLKAVDGAVRVLDPTAG